MVKIENGFAEVGAGRWLMGRRQPAAFFGRAVRLRRRVWGVRDRSWLDLVETTDTAKCADSSRPFITHIPCAAPISAVSSKVLVAPAGARIDAIVINVIPLSAQRALCVTTFGLQPEEPNGQTVKRSNGQTAESDGASDSAWVVMATVSRTARVALADGEVLSARPESVVAWTGKRPTGFCPKLSIWDVLLPRGPRDLLLTFYGPGIVWIEGARDGSTVQRFNGSMVQRRYYGV